ncbi:Hydrophobin 2 [Ophiocordyceps camponoti-floridani]|uniref:Hydrophobin 2 n=1 Tax=Ophiocordyceps camponoti-floridani TaxID=2030778 RepID=A0A8H4QC75_9HYPO|nr:Hydrophobin 2 [Ophiocordyceps camponoti-floridani]
MKFLALTLLLVGALANPTHWHHGGGGGGGGSGSGGGNIGGGGGDNNGGGSNGGGGNGGGDNGGGNNNGGGGGGGGGRFSCSPGLYSNAQCCATDVLGVADLDCKSPSRTPTSLADFNSICAGVGNRARCCVIPVAGLAVLCKDP